MLETDSGGTFEGWDCPCGAEQPDPERLYCDGCLDTMAEKMAAELDRQHSDDQERDSS